VPTLLYIDERGYAKMKICLARGKHSYDKRDSIKDRENKRELNRINKKRY
jgi:SsrA-binding protein